MCDIYCVMEPRSRIGCASLNELRDPCGAIPQLLADLGQAFECLRNENERLRRLRSSPRRPFSPPPIALDGFPCDTHRSGAPRTTGAGCAGLVALDFNGPHHGHEDGGLARQNQGRSLPQVQEFPRKPAGDMTEEVVAMESAEGCLQALDPTAMHRQLSHSLNSTASFTTRTCSVTCGMPGGGDISLQGELLRVWDEHRERELAQAATPRHGRHKGWMSHRDRSGSRNGDVLRSSSFLQPFVIHPNSRLHLLWDILSMITLMVDILLTPMAVFDIHSSELFPWFTWIAAGFWTMDMPVQCLVGFYTRGVLELRPRRILGKYVRTSFALDLILVCMDWVFVFSGFSTSGARMLRLTKGMRFFRMLRMIRLLRFIKLMAVFYTLDGVFQSHTMAALLRITRNIACIVVLNHFVACAWYGVAVFAEEFYDYKTWALSLPPDKIEGPRSTLYAYTTALHWALTQFTPASMEVHPENPIERIFTIAVMIGSLLAFSSVVASMTATMTQAMTANSEHVKNMELLRRFISEHRVSVDLSTRIYGYINRERKRLEARPVLERQVPMLFSLPDNLQKDLHTEVYTNVLTKHPLFNELETRDLRGLDHTSHTAMTDEMLVLGTQLWGDEDVATKMYFVLRGNLHLFPSGADTTKWHSVDIPSHVRAGDMLSEQALWLRWRYSGALVSITDVEIFALDAADFASIMHGGPAIRFLFQYAKHYHDFAGSCGLSLTCDVADTSRLLAQTISDLSATSGAVLQRSASFISDGTIKSSLVWSNLSNFSESLSSMASRTWQTLRKLVPKVRRRTPDQDVL